MTEQVKIRGDGSIVGDSSTAQVIKAEGSSTIKDVIQAVISGQVTGDVHIGDKVYTRSSLEELNDHLACAIAAYEARMYQAVLRPAPPEHPYKFLYAYELHDAPIFFGRKAATTALCRKVLSHRLTILHARSGAGKTSLLNAGLSPRLLSKGYLPVCARTYNDPTLAVKRAIVSSSLGPWPELLSHLSLHEFLGLACSHLTSQTKELVVVLDQFEEFFVLSSEPASRQPFINVLGECCEDEQLRVHFVIGIRGDYFTELAAFKLRLPSVFHNEYRLEPMNRDEAAEAVTQPLRRLKPRRVFEPALLESLLNDLAQGGLEPPHLQIVCTRLYEALKPGGRVITEAHYRESGRTERILGDYLRHEVEKLGQDAPLARVILTELITSENTRCALSAGELASHLALRHDLPRLESVLTDLIAARLLRRDESEGVARYELPHEYLIAQIRAWVTVEDVRAKQAREILHRALSNWRVNSDLLMDRAVLAFVHEQRELLPNLSDKDVEFLCRSAVKHQFGIDTWTLAAHRKHVNIWPILRPALAAHDLRVRASVVAMLPVVGEEALPALGRALRDRAPLVRVQAILALERIGTDTAHRTLGAGLRFEVYIPPDEDGPGLYIDRYPVTNKAYEIFLRDNPEHESPLHWQGRTAPRGLWKHPVVRVSWHDAQAYAAWAGKRLPTAQEWWRAAGGRRGWHYPWGNQFDVGRCNTRESSHGGTTPVSEYSPIADSPHSVADMAGNVWEWLVDEVGLGSEYRQLRGGAWFYSAEFARIDYDRFWRKPELRQDVIGFRLCFSVPQGE